jgi:hypothetical protein
MRSEVDFTVFKLVHMKKLTSYFNTYRQFHPQLMLSSKFLGLSPLMVETFWGQNEQYQLKILLGIRYFYATVIEARMFLCSTSQTFLSYLHFFHLL